MISTVKFPCCTAFFLLAWLTCCLDGASASDAISDLEYTTITNYVNEVDKIARVRIVSRTPVWDGGLVQPGDSLAKNYVCGHYYHAKVLDDFKGGSADFDFFSSVEADFLGFNRDYLVFAFRRDVKEAKRQAAVLEDRILWGKEVISLKLSCKMFGQYYVGTNAQTMFSFDPDAQAKLGGEWLLAPNRYSMTFCGGRPTGDFISALRDANDPSSAVIKWEGVRIMVKASVSNRFKFWLAHDERMHGC